jgi:hypothetical protein
MSSYLSLLMPQVKITLRSRRQRWVISLAFGSSATVFMIERRPVALRPALSDGLPLSGLSVLGSFLRSYRQTERRTFGDVRGEQSEDSPASAALDGESIRSDGTLGREHHSSLGRATLATHGNPNLE